MRVFWHGWSKIKIRKDKRWGFVIEKAST